MYTKLIKRRPFISDSVRKSDKKTDSGIRLKKAVGVESLVFLVVFIILIVALASIMGGSNMMNTMMNTAYSLLIDTVFYIMGIAVLAGAISAVFNEFGIVSLINKILSPLMKPVYNLPGAAAIGIITTYMSDNPAILTLADDKNFKRYFKKYQFPAITNLATAFGMGLIITTFMVAIPQSGKISFAVPVLIGNIGAIIGSIVSVRLMLHFTKSYYGTEEYCEVNNDGSEEIGFDYRIIHEGNIGSRLMGALLNGGKSGVEMGIAIIPGVVVICTIVMMLTNGPSDSGTYTGAAFEGIGLLPWIGKKLDFILLPLFGFSDPSLISVPITALGAAGAAIGLVPKLVSQGVAFGNDIAVVTAMCMCWSGYLSTHIAMMDTLKCRHLTGKAILSHTIGGLAAGIAANWIFKLFMLIS
jgi:hypothetical protein